MLAWLMSAPCRSSAATSSRSPAEQAAINTAPCAKRTFARRVPETLRVSRPSDPVRSVSEPSHRCSWSCRRCLAASDREWSVAAIFPGLIQLMVRGEAGWMVRIEAPRGVAPWRTHCDSEPWTSVRTFLPRCVQGLLGNSWSSSTLSWALFPFFKKKNR